MAPRRTATSTPVPAAPPAAVPMTTLSGFAVSVLAFIPIDAKDLRKQAEIPMLLLDIQEGNKDISALAPFLKNVEFRQQHIRKRFTADEAAQLMGTAPVNLELDKDQSHTDENTDIDGDGNTAEEADGDAPDPDFDEVTENDD